MKKLIFSMCLMSFMTGVFAQTCSPTDSTIMGAGNTNDVFYSMENGIVKTTSNTNWHLAFSTRATEFPFHPLSGVSIRVNSTVGENPQAGTSGITLKRFAGNNWSNWHSFDSTGLFSKPELIDSDSSWNLGAFVKDYNANAPFDFVFGSYNQSSHNISGTSIYVLYNESEDWYKKIFINELVRDTMWRFHVANLDNTDSVYVEINKNDFLDRNFAYYDIINNMVNDREPSNKTWDLLWTKYKAIVTQGQVTIPYSVTGVLHNIDVQTAQNEGKTCPNVWFANKTAAYEPSISTIGYDWKMFTGQTYAITDTFIYFVLALDGKTYKMTFKSYAGGSLGKTVISSYEATTGINDLNIKGDVVIYPNPSNSSFQIQTNDLVMQVSVFNMQGSEVVNTNSDTVNVEDLSSGIYSVLVRTDKGFYRQTLIKN